MPPDTEETWNDLFPGAHADHLPGAGAVEVVMRAVTRVLLDRNVIYAQDLLDIRTALNEALFVSGPRFLSGM